MISITGFDSESCRSDTTACLFYRVIIYDFVRAVYGFDMRNRVYEDLKLPQLSGEWVIGSNTLGN